MGTAPLFGVAALFAIVNGANDGSVLISSGLKVSSLRPVVAIATLLVALLLTPVVLGTRVATTLASGLVNFKGLDGELTFGVAVVGAIVVVMALSRIGVPTSLTLALIGGISGTGLALGLPVSWNVIGFVLIMGALAPLAGGVGGFMLSRMPGRLPSGNAVGRSIHLLHSLGFAILCVAYGANDGQKMLAVFAVTAGAASESAPEFAHLATIGLCFLGGTLLGLRRIAGTLGRKVAVVRPAETVAAQFSSATAVLATAVVGAPVSMTQAITGAVVGSSLIHGQGRVRWRTVFQIGIAWICTLPTAAAVAALIAILLRVSLEGVPA